MNELFYQSFHNIKSKKMVRGDFFVGKKTKKQNYPVSDFDDGCFFVNFFSFIRASYHDK